MWVINVLLLLWMIFAPALYEQAVKDGAKLEVCVSSLGPDCK